MTPIQSPFGVTTPGGLDNLDEAWDCRGSLNYKGWGDWAWSMGGIITSDGLRMWVKI